MFLDSFFQKFVVKEKKFYPLFDAMMENIIEAAQLLVDETKMDDESERTLAADKIKKLESAGDVVTAKLIDELYNSFVTPFDREDIHQLSSGLDTFLDYLDDSAKKIAIYQPKGVDEKLTEIAEYILEDAQCLGKIVHSLEKLRKNVESVDDICDRIKEIEHRVDDLYEEYMAHIFKFESNPVELIKKKNIVQVLEDSTDHAKHISETVRSIIVNLS